MKIDVLVSGMMVVDILTKVPSSFNKGTKHEVSKILVQGGAPAGNAACVIAKNNIKTAFLGYKSTSTLSQIATEEFKKCNVDTSLLITHANFQPAIAVVNVDSKNGDRTVFYSTENYQPLRPKDINEVWIKNCRLLFVDGYDVVGNLELLKIAKKYNVPSVLDIESGDVNILKEMISLGNHIILPLDGAQTLSKLSSPEDCLEYLSSLTEGQLVITDGANGSWASDDKNIIHQPAYKTKVVDTTGCGDAFHGAYAVALLDNKNLKERLEYASAYASIIASHFGGRSYFPNKEEITNKILNV
ncbi:ribokinase [Aureibaculum marinum]|uniref:Ribokinase n=1 Tax=Aureibaculum marinum TaxID=2487930 RepID=A0A3N4NWK2_9FLAO|nr:PfkB family carbohydrate kinase [Aureibaculum marinum]RPD99107.1 ribokinase [Aureibaculum marinum]